MNSEFFKSIHLETLTENTLLGFPLYLRYQDSFVLYKNADTHFTKKDRIRLIENNITEIYLRQGDLHYYNSYLEGQLPTLLADKKITVQRKGEILFETSYNYMSEVFATPKNVCSNINRCRGLVGNIINYLLQSPEAIKSLTPLVSHNHYTYVHSVQVATLTIALSSRILKPTSKELIAVGMGALLHDFGKTFVPNEILEKKGKLTQEEWNIMKSHPDEGYGYLKTCSNLDETGLLIVQQHHEKYNGKGYSSGREGDDIDVRARIAALADVYCALTTNRAYRDALPSEAALDIMKGEMAGSFDEKLFSELLILLGQTQEKEESATPGEEEVP